MILPNLRSRAEDVVDFKTLPEIQEKSTLALTELVYVYCEQGDDYESHSTWKFILEIQ